MNALKELNKDVKDFEITDIDDTMFGSRGRVSRNIDSANWNPERDLLFP